MVIIKVKVTEHKQLYYPVQYHTRCLCQHIAPVRAESDCSAGITLEPAPGVIGLSMFGGIYLCVLYKT